MWSWRVHMQLLKVHWNFLFDNFDSCSITLLVASFKSSLIDKNTPLLRTTRHCTDRHFFRSIKQREWTMKPPGHYSVFFLNCTTNVRTRQKRGNKNSNFQVAAAGVCRCADVMRTDIAGMTIITHDLSSTPLQQWWWYLPVAVPAARLPARWSLLAHISAPSFPSYILLRGPFKRPALDEGSRFRVEDLSLRVLLRISIEHEIIRWRSRDYFLSRLVDFYDIQILALNFIYAIK